MAFDLPDETREIDWLGVEVATADLDATTTIPVERMRRDGNDRRGAERCVRVDELCRFPAVHSAQCDVHQHEIWLRLARHSHAVRPVLGANDLVSRARQSPTEHIAVELVVFD